MTIHESTYKHWNERHTGIWHRRWVIASNGLRAVFQGRGMKQLVTACWIAALLQTFILFLFGQLLVEDSIIFEWLGMIGSQARQTENSLISSLIKWLESRPDISVRTTYNLLFYFFTTRLSTVAVICVAMTIPHLITRDLSSNAITIYSAKAVSKFDYLFGKFCTLMLLLFMTWLGPTLAAWFLGNFLAPDWHFFWHSRASLWNALLYVGSNMFLLSLFGLGVSAISGREKTTVGIWIALWILGWAFVGTAKVTKDWLKYLSFKFNLDQMALATFNLKGEIERARENVPMFDVLIQSLEKREQTTQWQTAELTGALMGLGILAVIACLIIWRKVRTE